MTGMAKIRASRRPAEAGMTLIEILVAMTVLGFLVLAMGGGLRLALRSWDTVERRQDEAGGVMLAHRLVGRMLSEAYPVAVEKKTQAAALAFEGGPERLAFAAVAPPRFGGGGLVWIVLALEQGAGGKVLTMSLENYFAARSGLSERREERVLLEGIGQARFAYFGAPAGEELADWQDAWTGEAALPMLVRMDVQFAAADRRAWPGLVAALPVLGEGACEYDALSRRCANRANSN